MGLVVPFRNEVFEFCSQHGLGRKVDNAQPLALQNRKPLLDLVHPGTMPRRKVEEKARMRLHPLLDLFAVMGRDIVTDEVDSLDDGRNFPVQMLQKGEKLALPLALVTLAIDMPGPRIKGGTQIPLMAI